MAERIGEVYAEVGARIGEYQKKMGTVQRSFRDVGARLGRLGKRAGIAFGAAIVAGTAFAIKAAATQEQAEKDLEAALQAHGDAVDSLLPKFKNLASSIQAQTTYGDEAVLSMMAQIRNLGVTSDRMEEATKGTIGLAKALKIDQAAAARYAALAMQGEFTVLQRYVPELRKATTEGEKQAIVQELMRKGYEQAQAETQTVAGAFKSLRNSVGDVFEGFGKMIFQSVGLRDLLVKLTEHARNFATRLTELAKSDFVERLIMQGKLLFNNMRASFLKIFEVAKAVLEPIWKPAIWAFKTIGVGIGNLVKIFTAAGKNIGNIFTAVWDKIVHPTKKFEMPELIAFQDLISELAEAPEFPKMEASFSKMQERLTEISEEALEREKNIFSEYSDAITKKRKIATEKETEAVQEGAEAVVTAEKEKRKAVSGTIQFAEAAREMQERIGIAPKPMGAKAPLTTGAIAAGQARTVQESTKKAEEQRDSTNQLLRKIIENTAPPVPVTG